MARSYDLKLVVCTVGPVELSGYGEDGGISFEWAAEIAERTKTADGQVVYSRNNDRELLATLTLMQTSKALPLLMAQLELQHQDNLGIPLPVMLPLPFMLVDANNGDTIAGECVFISRPAPSKGKTVGEIEFQLSLPSPRLTLGVANLI